MAFGLICACDDIDKEDTGGSSTSTSTDDTIAYGQIDPLPETFFVNADGFCEAGSLGHVNIPSRIADVEINGLLRDTGGGSEVPPLNEQVVRAVRTAGPCTYVPSGVGLPKTVWGYVHTSGLEPDETWRSNPGDDGITECMNGNCSDSCSGEYKVEIDPRDSLTSCEKYTPVRLDLEYYDNSAKEVSQDSTCVPGAGSFWLLPASIQDRDHDGNYRAVFLPVQTSGTGKMTRNAWGTKIEVVEDKNYDLRVIKSEQSFTFDHNDELVNPSTVSVLMDMDKTFATGVIDGLPPFTVNEISLEDRGSLLVDMEWSCGNSATERTDLGQGYKFSLSDIGCSIPQNLVLRYYTSPNRVELELYGNPSFKYVEPTTTLPGGEVFSFAWNKLNLEGVLTSYNAQSANVTLNTITWGGVDACTTGSYTFLAEE